jgi:putative transposase
MKAFIDAYRSDYGVEPICKVLPIAPSTYWEHARRDAALNVETARVHAENLSVYGVRQVWHRLAGMAIGWLAARSAG